MPKINQEEYEVLKALDDKWKYLARNNMYGAKLEAHTSRPYKMTDSHWSNGDMTLELLGGEHLFQFIQWEDEDSYNIQELIEEYLYDNQPKLFIDGQEQSFEFIEESEEKEVKKQKLIKKWESAIGAAEFYGKGKEDRLIEYMRDFVDDLNQLDEPEVLSSDWIQDNQLMWTSIHGAEYYVPANKLYGKIVPKQEEITEEQAWEVIRGKYRDEVLQSNIDYVESQGYVVIEKPTVPQFVADWHVQNKYYLLSAKFERIADWEDKRVVDWYRRCSGRHKNNRSNAQETIALMDLVGYEVEEEQKYYALIKGHENIASNDKYWNYNTDMEELSVGDSEVHPNVISEYVLKATKDEWANLGITDDNADFELVEEMEEC